MSCTDNENLVANHLQLSWNEGRYEELRNIVQDTFYYQTTFTDDILDLEQYIKYIQLFRMAMPDLILHVEELMSKDDRVMSHISFCGSVAMPFLGIPASDKIITFPAVSFWDIRKGKISSLNTLIDISGIERQLGVPLSPGPSLSTALK